MTQKKKILYVKNGDFEKGGVETFIYNHYQYLDKNLFKVDFIIHSDHPNLDSSEKKYYESNGSNVFYVPTRNRNLKKNIRDVNEIMRLNKYDIIHTHMGSSAGITLKQAKKNGIPIRIAHSHGTKPIGNFSTSKKLKLRMLELSKYVTRVYATEYAACSIDAGAYLFGKNNLSKVTQIKNAVDLKLFSFSNLNRKETRGELKLSKDKFVIGQIGRFDENKNQIFSLEILKKLVKDDKRFHLFFIGTGQTLEYVKNEVYKSNLLSNVTFMESTSEVYKYLSAMDVLLLPSYHEGLPLVTIEAQGTGLPILSSKNVSKEIKLSELVSFLDIEKIDCWVESIKKIAQKEDNSRKTDSKIMINSGYEISQSGKKLNQWYKNLLKGQEN